jgi:hypothetical protein
VSDRRIFNSHMKGNTNVRFEILQRQEDGFAARNLHWHWYAPLGYS